MRFLTNILAKAGLIVDGTTQLNTIANATTDTDTFLVSDSGVIKYRTGAQLLSDIGGASASGYVPYAGATTNLDLGTHTILAAKGTFSSSGSSDTVGITHSSGSGIALNITKSGNGEGLYINKTSGSGNAATIIGTLNATTLVKSGGTSSQFLKADGSVDSTAYGTGSVTSVALSAPTGFSVTGSPVTSSGTLALAFASGYSLPTTASQSNWDTAYNNRITSLTTTGTSGAATLVSNVLNIPQYQAQGNYITSLTGEATASGPGAASVTLSTSAVTGKVLTGLNVTGGTVLATDSILTAFGKLQNQVNGLAGGVTYQGTWNASTNSPALTSSVGTKGYYYVVSVAGSTNLNGVIDWNLGDWAIFNGSTWEKVDNTDAVVSVNGFTGSVTLTTSNISEGTNLYYTDTRARAAISLTTTGSSGASTYNNSTGVLNVPQYTLAGLGGVPTTRSLTINGTAYDLSADRSWSVGTVTSIATTGPITGGTITGSGTIGITQATTSTSGYLSSTDWNTFNNKQNAITLTTTGSSGSATLVGATLNIPNYTLSGLGGVPSSRQLTINGTTLDLSADRTWSVGTVTSITFSGPLTGGTITGSGTVGILQASGSQGGYLSSTDWSTFNSKEPAIAAGTTAQYWRGDKSWQTLNTTAVPEGTNLYYTDARARAAITLTTTGTSGASTYSGGIFNIPQYQGQITLTTTGSSGAATFVSNTLNIPTYTLAGLGGVSGSGTTNYIPKFTSSSAIGNSILYQDGTTTIGIGISTPYTGAKLEVKQASTYDGIYVSSSTTARNSISLYNTGSLSVLESTYLGGGGSYTPIGFFVSGAEQMRLTSTGLGIGTSSPAYKLDVSGTSRTIGNLGNPGIYISGNMNGTRPTTNEGLAIGQNFQAGTVDVGFWNTYLPSTFANTKFSWYQMTGASTSTELMTLTNGGNLGLGVTPSAWAGGLSVIQGSSSLSIANSGNGGMNIVSNGYYGSNWTYISTAAASWYQQISGQHVWYTAPSGTAGNAISFTQAMTLDASGNLGVGTTSQNERLRINSSSNGQARLTIAYSDTPISYFGSYSGVVGSGSATDVILTAANNLAFGSGGATERMRITSGGNVGIGTTSPNRTLTVNGLVGVTNGTANTQQLVFSIDGTAAYLTSSYIGSASYVPMVFEVGGSERMRITSGGNLLVGGTSDAGIKIDVLGANARFKSTTAYNAVIVDNTGTTGGGSFIARQDGNAISYFSISGAIEGNTTSDGAIYVETGKNLRFYTNGSGAEKMRITSGGNVGIGTTSPTSLLHVNSGTTATQTIANFAAANYGSSSSRTYIQIGTQYADGSSRIGSINTTGNQSALVFQTQSASSGVFNDAMYINGSGNVGIGTTSPSAKLQIKQSTSNWYDGIRVFDGSSNTWIGIGNTGSAAVLASSYDYTGSYLPLTFYTSDAERMRITSGGELLVNTTTDAGDYKLQVNGNSYLNGITKITKSVETNIVTKTATYTLTSDDYTVVFDLSGNATANLPDATTCTGRIYVIKINTTNAADTLTIDPNGSQTIDGNSTYAIQCQYALTIQSDGSNWRIIADFAGGNTCL